MTAPIVLWPIGYVRTGASTEQIRAGAEELDSEIEVLEAYEAGLTGIDGFSHLIVLSFLHSQKEGGRSTLQVKPRGLLRLGLTHDDLPTIGVFACDSPNRPNPVGVSVVRFVGRDGRRLGVRGLDCFDGTPVLDLKPYTADRSVPEVRAPAWHDELLRRAGTRRV